MSEIHLAVLAGVNKDGAPFVSIDWDTEDAKSPTVTLDPAVAQRLAKSLLNAVAHLKAAGHAVDESKVRTTPLGFSNAKA